MPTSRQRTTSEPSTPRCVSSVSTARRLLHVAQSLFHDHIPAKRHGLPSVWINRRHERPGWGATPAPSEEWSYDLEFTSMADFADTVDQAFNNANS